MRYDPLGPPPRHPDSVFLIAMCLFAGVSQLAVGSGPGLIAQTVPPLVATAWALLLTFGAVLVLAGTFWRGTYRDGLFIELVGRVMFAPPATAYGGIILAIAPGATGWLAAAPFFGFALSCGWRVRQIMQRIGGVRAVLKTMLRARERAEM